MKCVLDITVNLKRLIATDDKKLNLKVNGRSILQHQFSAMREAGIDDVFVLISADDPARCDISSEAFKFGYTVTFLEVAEHLIQTRRSITVAESYLKSDFIYLPVNRLVSGSLLKTMVSCKATKHTFLSLVFVGEDHPHINKSNVFRIDYAPSKNGKPIKKKDGSVLTLPGYDIGIYRCPPAIFKLIDKVAQNKAFSWSRLQAAVGRAGRSAKLPTKNVEWCVIETKDDVKEIEGHQVQVLVDDLELNSVDVKLLSGIYRQALPEFMKNQWLRNFSMMHFILLFVAGCALILIGQIHLIILAGFLLFSLFCLYPIVNFVNRGKQNNEYSSKKYSSKEYGRKRESRKVLAFCRMTVLTTFGLACYLQFGLSPWLFVSILLLSAEVYFMMYPIEIENSWLILANESFAIHAVIVLIATVYFSPPSNLLIFALLAGSISVAKGMRRYKEFELERQNLVRTE